MMYNVKDILNKLTPKKNVLIIGAAIVDIIIDLEQLPKTGEDVTAKSTKQSVGGCAYNVADVLSKLNLPFDLMIPLGNGAYSEIIYKAFKEQQYPIFRVKENIDNGYCLSLVENNGERTFITMPGLELAMKKEWFNHLDMKKYDYIYVSGYELEGENGKVLVDVLQNKQNTAKIVFDPGPRLSFIDRDVLEKILKMSCLLTINDKEAINLAKMYADINTVEEAGKYLFTMTNKPVVITNGKKGALIAADKITIVDGFSVKVKDTIGAGDSHTGSLLAGLSCDIDLETATYLANKIASVVVSREGAATAPNLNELLNE